MRKTSLASFIVGLVFAAAAIALVVLGIVALCPVSTHYQYRGMAFASSQTSPLYPYATIFFMMGGFSMVVAVLLFNLSAQLFGQYQEYLYACDCDCDCDDDCDCGCGCGGHCDCETVYDVEDEKPEEQPAEKAEEPKPEN